MSEAPTIAPKKPRPLSPHLQIYRPQLTSVLSILNRMTGLALTAGLAMLTWWLVAIAQGPDAYAAFHDFATSILGLLMLAGWSWALFYHLLGGLRHLMWDTGSGLDLPSVYKSGWAVVIGSFVLTALIWVGGYLMKGYF